MFISSLCIRSWDRDLFVLLSHLTFAEWQLLQIWFVLQRKGLIPDLEAAS